jgi:hypothetical protein
MGIQGLDILEDTHYTAYTTDMPNHIGHSIRFLFGDQSQKKDCSPFCNHFDSEWIEIWDIDPGESQFDLCSKGDITAVFNQGGCAADLDLIDDPTNPIDTCCELFGFTAECLVSSLTSQ